MGGEGVTRAEILALPAGPDLDAEVAKARGHRVYTHNGHLREHMGYKSSRKLAPYSQLWQDAGPLLDEMLSDGVSIQATDRYVNIQYSRWRTYGIARLGDVKERIAKAYCIWRLGVGS